jgi:DNA-directed RNA polymerase subunit RPC12/RpoP
MFQMFNDDPKLFYNLAYKCGGCQRIVVGRPKLVEDAWKILNGGFPEYACGNCGELLYTISPENGLSLSERGTLS